MTTLIEAARQALEALDGLSEPYDVLKAQHALRTAIAEAEKQEPVAYLCENAVGHKYFRWKKPSSTYKPIPLYTTPPAAQPAPVQEPVGELILGGVIDTKDGPEYEEWDVEWNTKAVEALQEKLVTSHGVTLMLYTTPPAAQRQPLTKEEIDDIWNRYRDEMGEASINDAYDIARAIEAAHGIKEKNT